MMPRNRPSLETGLRALGQWTQTKTTAPVSATGLAAGAFVTTTVTFDTAFSAPPGVSVSLSSFPGGSAYIVARTGAVTASTCVVQFVNTGAAAWTFSGLTATVTAVGS